MTKPIRPRRPSRHTPPLILGVILSCLLLGSRVGWLPPAQAGDMPGVRAAAPTVTKEDLEKQKLAQEILQLKNANASHVALWDRIAGAIPLVTALVAVLGVWATISKMLDDRKQAEAQAREQAQSDLEQREHERLQRDTESLRWQAEQQAERQRQLEESFGAALANLRGEDDAGKAGAVVSLMTFLKPEYAGFHEQVFLILRAMLKLLSPPLGQPLDHSAVKPLFVRAFEQAFKALPPSSPMLTDGDLARMYLFRASLPGLILHHADLGFSAMQGADLTGADLFRVRGIKVQWEGACLSKAKLGEARLKFANCRGAKFHEAWLVAAVLKGADLREADFRQASLQSAHLEKAKLESARFQEADLNDAYFIGASFDDITLRSMAGAKNWRKAHFSPEIVMLLEQASAAAKLKQEKRDQEKAQKNAEKIGP